jgi:hypothetical protein
MSDSTYGDGTYGANSGSSRDFEHDQHESMSNQQAIVMALAEGAGSYGITGRDVQAQTGWGDSPKSRALSNLLRDGKLIRLAERRDRGSIHVVPDQVGDRPTEPYRSISDKHHTAGFEEGIREGVSIGLDRAFVLVDDADTLGEALIAIRRLIEESR